MLFWQKNGFLVDRHAWQFHLMCTLGSSQVSPLPCLTHLVWNFVLCKILICLRYCIITSALNMFGSLFLFPAIWKEQVFVYLFVCFALWAGQRGTDTILAYFMMTVATLGVQWWCSKMTLSWFLGGHHEMYLPFKFHISVVLAFWYSSLLLLMNNPKALRLILETGSWGRNSGEFFSLVQSPCYYWNGQEDVDEIKSELKQDKRGTDFLDSTWTLCVRTFM